MGSTGPRRQAREIALQTLYAAEARGPIEPGAIERAYGDITREFTLPTRARARARELVRGVVEHLKEIDDRIAAASRHWKLERLAAVDRNVLRIATWELLFDPQVPTEVVIDEAVEVARRFAGDPSPAFVNGVLDAIVQREARGAQ